MKPESIRVKHPELPVDCELEQMKAMWEAEERKPYLILEGGFYEGEYVTVSMAGDIVKRKVWYDSFAGDLFIWYKNRRFFYYKFEYAE